MSLNRIMTRHTIETLTQFAELVQQQYFALKRGKWIFRGHADKEWTLTPVVGRLTHTSPTRDKYERSLLAQFKRLSIQFLERVPKNDFEWLGLAQHHGLPTRRLDWSYNPYVALYFAVSQHQDTDGKISALHAVKMISAKRVTSENPLTQKRLGKFVPSIVTTRLAAQEGLFTLHPNVENSLEDDIRADWTLEEILIPSVAKELLQYYLYRMGVHQGSLFPDVDGLANHIRWKHSVLSDVDESEKNDDER